MFENIILIIKVFDRKSSVICRDVQLISHTGNDIYRLQLQRTSFIN